MAKNDQPLLSAKFDDPYNPDWSKIRFPIFASPKIDGFRCRIHPDLGGISRTYKTFPNTFSQKLFWQHMQTLKYLDGEICAGPITNNSKLCNDTQSAMMTQHGEPDWHYYVFDNWYNPDQPWTTRAQIALEQVEKARNLGFSRISWLNHELFNDLESLLAYIEQNVSAGYEGTMLRDPNGRYKNGRSTLKEGILIKVKQFEDSEAIVTGFEPLERNQNEQIRDAFGHAKRSSHQAGKVQDDLLGVLLAEHETWGSIRIGSGFDVSQREDIWNNRDSYLGKRFTFSYQPHGTRDKPRQPIFKTWRPEGF